MNDDPISWAELVVLAARPAPTTFCASGRSELGSGRHQERDTFTVQRDGDRWRIDQHLDPVRVVGDATRDPVSEGGGLSQVPSPQGWIGLPATGLLRPDVEAMADLSIFTPVSTPQHEVVAGRHCWRVQLAYSDKDPFTLHIDAETGIRLSMTSIEGTITLDTFDDEAQPRPDAFLVLDHTPDIDLTMRRPTPERLEDVVRRILALSPAGIEVDVRAYDDLADSYTLVLRDQAGVVALFDRRSNEHATVYEQLLPGRQERWGWEPWNYSFDARDDGPDVRRWVDLVRRQFVMTTPRTNDGTD